MNTSAQKSSRLLIIGAGGLGSEYLWVAEQMNREIRRNCATKILWEILGYADESTDKKGMVLGGYEVHGTLYDALLKFGADDLCFAVAVGSNLARARIAKHAEQIGWTPVTLKHPSAIVAETAEIGPGSYLAPCAVVCPGARVGRHVILNTSVSVGHDSTIGDFVQVCPGARVSGGCRVAEGGFLGSNATLAPRIAVGEGAVVGANSLVVRKVASRTTVLGCPAIAVGIAAH